MRLFVAVYPPAAALDDLAVAVDRLRLGQRTAAGDKVGLTAAARWHLTLAFLGEVPEQRVAQAEAAVAAGVAGWRAAGAAPPRLRLAGAGRFGRGRFTVLWVGLAGELDQLEALARQVRRALRGAKLPYDDRRPFRPHLTLARPGDRLDPEDLAADLADLGDYAGPDWTVAELVLVASRLGANPGYRRLAAAPLS